MGMSFFTNQVQASVKKHALVRYLRAGLDAEEMYSYGFAVGCSKSWLLTHYVADHLRLDGYDAVRMQDITEFDVEFDKAPFLRRCMEIKRQMPSLPIGIQLDDTRSLLESIIDQYPVVVVHREQICPDECEIGTLKMVSDEAYALRWMTPTAEWADDEEVYRFEDVTRVTFGSEYETTIAVVAGLIKSKFRGASGFHMC